MSAKTIGFILGAAAFLLVILLPTPSTFHAAASRHLTGGPNSVTPDELAYSMKVVLALLLLMII
jgi:hypothetical protein